MKFSNETKVGLIGAVAITILVIGFNFLKGESLLSKSNTYYAVYKQVDGLFRSNPVVLNGYKVGHVNSVEMNHDNLNLIVSMQIPNTIKIPANTVFKITNNDLLGSKAVEIIMGDSNVYAQNGDTLKSRKDAGMAQALTSVLSPLSERVNNVLGNIDTAISDVSLNSTLNDLSDALASFKTTAQKMNRLLDGKDEQLTSILENIDNISGDLKKSTPKIESIIANLDSTSQIIAKMDFKGISVELTETVHEIQTTLKAIQDGQGSLGKLATDDQLWVNLNKSTHDLDSLVNDIIKYPRRYTGITEKQRKKGDKQKEVEEGIQLPDGKD